MAGVEIALIEGDAGDLGPFKEKEIVVHGLPSDVMDEAHEIDEILPKHRLDTAQILLR